jgi:hypothetical protein
MRADPGFLPARTDGTVALQCKKPWGVPSTSAEALTAMSTLETLLARFG